jgi:hypothetical protein
MGKVHLSMEMLKNTMKILRAIYNTEPQTKSWFPGPCVAKGIV